MVLIQLLLPASGAASAGGLVPLAETRRQLAERFNGLTAYLRSPAKGLWTAPDRFDRGLHARNLSSCLQRHQGICRFVLGSA